MFGNPDRGVGLRPPPSGVVIRNMTHDQTMYRDKANDYGNQL